MKTEFWIRLLTILFAIATLPSDTVARINYGDAAVTGANAGIWKHLHTGGYVQFLPVRISTDLPEPLGSDTWMDYRLQNRLNLRYDATPDLTFHWQMRTRLFAGDLVRDFPEYVDDVTRDEGLVDLSWTIVEENDWLLHYIPDRLYAEWDLADWNVRAGRQRVNWGVNMITNPNDIFNIYSIYDFDYPERPGSDAIRIQRFLGFASRFEIAASPARDFENSVAALLYAFHARGYDIQLIGGYYMKQITSGIGWAGNLRGAGLKGETMFYHDIEKENGSRETNFILAVSIDYIFSNSLFLVTEILYNQQGGMDTFQLTAERLAPDNPSFSRYQAAIQLSYPIHPLIDGILTMIGYPDEDSIFISPALRWSVIENLDLEILGQFFIAGDESALARAGDLVTASLKYNF